MTADGRVVQVSVSRGGVPKLPVVQAWVGRLGLDGDAHREHTVHGGPHRAVCLFSLEAIERLQADGHRVAPGSVGENLTTTGIEWSTLPLGTRARVGERLLLELASSTTPCETQRPNFSDGRFSRINIALHPTDSRMYARVLEEGFVRPGDAVELLAPAADSHAAVEALLMRIDPVERGASLKLWAAARAAGHVVHVLNDGDICAGASSELAEPAFNHAQGLRMMPQLLPAVLAHYDGQPGRRLPALIPHVAPARDSLPRHLIGVHAAAADALAEPPTAADGIEVGHVDRADQSAWIDTYVGTMARAAATAWRALLPYLLAEPTVHAFLARVDGRPAGVGLLHIRRHTGLLRGGLVLSGARGQGIQRALIAARTAVALELGCELIASMAEVESVSARNLAAMGLARIDTHPVYEYVPA